VDLLGDNVDCVIRGGEILDQGLVARRIGELNFVSCAAPAYIARHGQPRHPLELASDAHRVVHYFSARTGRILPLDFRKGAEHHEVASNNYVVSVNDSNAYVNAGVAGLGVIQSPSFMVQQLIGQGLLEPGAGARGLSAQPASQHQGPGVRRLGRRIVRRA
jgi:DNA-binding transcriptional LysR family regulator